MPPPRLEEAFSLTSRSLGAYESSGSNLFTVSAAPTTFSTLTSIYQHEALVTTQGESIFVYDPKDQTALNAFNVSSSTRFTCPAVSIIEPKMQSESNKAQSNIEEPGSTQRERNVIAGVAPNDIWIWTRQELDDASAVDNHIEKRIKTMKSPVIALEAPPCTPKHVVAALQDGTFMISDLSFSNISSVEPSSSLHSSSTISSPSFSSARIRTFPYTVASSFMPKQSQFKKSPVALVSVIHTISLLPQQHSTSQTDVTNELESTPTSGAKKKTSRKRKSLTSESLDSGTNTSASQANAVRGPSTARISFGLVFRRQQQQENEGDSNQDEAMQVDNENTQHSQEYYMDQVQTIDLEGNDISEVVFTESGFVLCSHYDNALTIYKISSHENQEKLICLFYKKVKLSSELNQPSLLPLSGPFVLLASSNNLVIFDIKIACPIAYQNLNPSATIMKQSHNNRTIALTLAPSPSTKEVTEDIAMVWLGGSTIVCTPVVIVDNESKISYALARSDLTSRFLVQNEPFSRDYSKSKQDGDAINTTAGGFVERGSDWVRNPLMSDQKATHLRERGEARQRILQTLLKEQQDVSTKSQAWKEWAESERKALKDYRDAKETERKARKAKKKLEKIKNQAKSVEADGIDEMSLDEKEDKGRDEFEPQLPVPFVQKVIKISVSAGISDITSYLLDRNVISNAMIPEGILPALYTKRDWPNILSALKSCPDIPEVDVVQILKECLKSTDSEASSEKKEYLEAMLVYPMSKSALRQALRKELDFTSISTLIEGLVPLVDHNNSAISIGATEMMQLCLDSHLVSFLQHDSVHPTMRQIKDNIQEQLELLKLMRDLSVGPLNLFSEETERRHKAEAERIARKGGMGRDAPTATATKAIGSGLAASDYQVELIEL